MNYLFIDENSISLLGVSKALLGQYSLSHFHKIHTTTFIDGNTVHIDIIASALKEAISTAQPKPITERDTVLILPQHIFSFSRFTIPADMSESAVVPFIKDKAKSELKIDVDNEYTGFYVKPYGGQQTVFFFSISAEKMQQFQDALGLLQLTIKNLIPDTIAYYTLFQKALKLDKNEKILFTVYNDPASYGYLFDSVGLLEENHHTFGPDIKVDLKKITEEYTQKGVKIDRLILAGSESSSVRQDLFTKDVGVWTNMLEKIIDNFYQDYLKQLASDQTGDLKLLHHVPTLGAFIFMEENKDFSFNLGSSKGSNKKMIMPSFAPRQGSSSGPQKSFISKKTFFTFLVSFLLSFAMIYIVSRMDTEAFKKMIPTQIGQKPSVTQAPTVKPTAAPTAVPESKREDVRIMVLNGSGTVGKAGTVKDLLLELGYTDVLTGNADNFGYDKTEIQIKDGKEAEYTLLKSDLEDMVTLPKATTLDEDDTADIILIIGADFK